MHFGFGLITPDYEINAGDKLTSYEFENFKQVSGPKRILSFSGWDFSTGPGTYTIFRKGVEPANRLKLATNIFNFIKKHNLNGVDINWEYPSVSYPTGNHVKVVSSSTLTCLNLSTRPLIFRIFLKVQKTKARIIWPSSSF